MKKILLSIITLTAVAAFYSCNKVENRAVLNGDPGAAVITVPSNTLTIDSLASATATAYKFTWTKPNWGAQVATNYVLQIAKNANDLGKVNDSSFVYAVPGKTELELTNGDMRLLGISSGVPEGVVATYYARVVSTLAGNTSDVKPLTGAAKPFSMSYYNTPLAKLYVPGDYQGWNPAAAPTLTGIAGSGVFSGIIEKSREDGTLSSGDFKFTSIPDWSGTNYGKNDSDPKALNPDGGAGNLNLPDGTYYFEVNTKSLKWNWESRSWGIIGTATPDGWNSDQNMRYNAATKMYEITMNLVAGEYKFRANDSWTTNLGDDGGDGTLEPNGANIVLAESGNYTVSLDVDGRKFTIKKN